VGHDKTRERVSRTGRFVELAAQGNIVGGLKGNVLSRHIECDNGVLGGVRHRIWPISARFLVAQFAQVHSAE
jgi:hypothetical protein